MIRLSKETETHFIADMWYVCFDDPEKFIKWNFSRNYSPENTLVFEENGILLANMQLMPYEMSFCGQNIPVSYISGVATLPEYRMRGCYKKLQAAAFNLMAKRGIPAAILVPFNFDFYEKQGFTAYCDKSVYTLDAADFPRGNSAGVSISEETIKRLGKIYAGCMTGFNGFIARSEKDWCLILEDVLLNSGGCCDITEGGYALYLTDKKTGVCEIFELMCENQTAAENLLGGIENAKKFKITSPCSSSLEKISALQQNRFAMLRIVDAEYILNISARDFQGDISIKIIDENIDANNDIFYISNGAVSRACQGIADFTLDIKQFAAFASGYETADGNLSRLFKKRENFVNLLL